MLKTPIVYICFNRSKIVEKTFKFIERQKPIKLYIIMDGPRLNNRSDENEVLEIQKFLDNSINWQCKINKIYSKVNLGLKKRIISGINEVFNNDDNAIVLEDDCLPHNDFFYFCESILEKYKNHKKVRFITGNNFQKKNNKYNYDYYFSKYSHIWGWACTKKLWEEVNFNHNYWESYIRSDEFKNIFETKDEFKYWSDTFNLIGKGNQSSWSIYLLLTMWKNNYLTVTPRINLVQNLGLENGTNTKALDLETNLSLLKINKPLIHPVNFERDIEKDLYVFNNIYKKSYIKRLIKKFMGFYRNDI